MDLLFLFFKGIFLGIANVIPGVSGGTIAVVLNIFDRLIDAINHFTSNVKKHLLFLAPLLLGAGFGILAFSVLINYSLENYSLPTCGFFAGLVAGSLPLIYKISKSKRPTKKSNISYLIYSTVAFVVVILMATLKTPEQSQTIVGDVSVSLMVKALLGGIIASAAMIIPGVSGSFVLVLLGLYNVIIGYVALIKDFLLTWDFAILVNIVKFCLPLGVGVIIGAVIISKLIEFLMNKYHTQTYYTILGLIAASLVGIFLDPIAYASYPSAIPLTAFAFTAVSFVVGFAISLLLGKE